MALILLRHTSPDVAPGTCYGQTDLDVATTFEDEAAVALAALPPVQSIVTSPLIRCQKLADYVGARLALPVTSDARLMEMDFGHWEGRPWSDIERSEIDAWAADFLHALPHGGESVSMLQTRIRAALADWFAKDKATLIVTHAGVVRAALATGPNASDFNTQIDFGGFIIMSELQGVPDE